MPATLYEPCRNNIFSYSYQRQAFLCLLLLLLAEFPDWTHLADNLLTCVSQWCTKASQSTRLRSSSRWEQLHDRHTQHAKSLSTRGCGCEIPLHTKWSHTPVPDTACNEDALQLPDSTGASQTIEYLSQHFLFLMSLILSNWTFFPTFKIINKSCWQVMCMGENGVKQNRLHICTKQG